MKKKQDNPLYTVSPLLGLVVIIVILALYELLHIVGNINNTIFPSIISIIQSLINSLFVKRTLLPHIAISIVQLGIGYFIALLFGIILAIMCYVIPIIEYMFRPLLEILRSIAPIALIPVFMFIFGLGIESKIAVIFWVSWSPIYLNTLDGMKETPKVFLKFAGSIHAKPILTVVVIVLPYSLPQIVTGLRIAIGSAFMSLIAAEMIGSNKGLGFMVSETSLTFRHADMYATIIVIGILGLLCNAFFRLIETWTFEIGGKTN